MTAQPQMRDSLGPMGAITLEIQRYNQGLIDLDALVTFLEAFDFQTPARFEDIPADVFEADAQAEERTYEDEGTLDEVLAARDRGLLSKEDLQTIIKALVPADA